MYEQLAKIHDFSLPFIWRGNEDKPFYRAHYASVSQQHLLRKQPFGGNALRNSQDCHNLLSVQEKFDRAFVSGIVKEQ